MIPIKQTAIGSHNSQVTKVFNRPFDPVDICASNISQILKKIAHLDFLTTSAGRLRPPNISAKNEINAIDAANSIQIEETYSLWDEITDSIRSDAEGGIASDYAKAAYILNQLYLAKFQKDFPGFKIHAIGIYCENTGANLDEAHVLVHLMHYMYLSCQLGLTP
ncbi:hypothetical protein [Aromatoleum evansii]|uniref:hypothetical protein n=1 Tax=Aromatoleum evansii TaxID=59406 RepID=UPI00145D5A45|nr:hypothetical protein [Aromatoleum evansii]NMG28442.1 hypothetical protein [Aromatoleum evansii]